MILILIKFLRTFSNPWPVWMPLMNQIGNFLKALMINKKNPIDNKIKTQASLKRVVIIVTAMIVDLCQFQASIFKILITIIKS